MTENHIRYKESVSSPKWYWFVLIIFLGLTLRIIELDKQSIWLDEMTSIQVAGEPLSHILAGHTFDNHTPPLYYAFLNLWGRVLPLREVTLRLPSALIDVCNILLVISLCRRFISRKNTFLVACAYAISPFMLYYAQEGRMYTLAVFFTLAYCLAFERIALGEKNLITWAIVSGILLALGAYTHYYIVLFGFGVVSLSLFYHRHSHKHIMAILLSAGVAILLFIPWIPIVMKLAGSGGQSFRKYTFSVIPYAVFRFVVGYAIFPLNMHTKEAFSREVMSHAVEIAAVFACVLFLLWNCFTSVNRRGHFIAALAWVIATPALIGLLLSLKSPMLSERYLIVTLPFFLLLILGYLDVSRTSGKIAITIFFVLMVIGDVAYYINPQFGKTQWRDVASYASKTMKEDGVIIVEPPYLAPVLLYYFDGPQHVYPARPKKVDGDFDDSLAKCIPSLGKSRQVLLISSGNISASCSSVLSSLATKNKMQIFPLEVGVTCTTWELRE